MALNAKRSFKTAVILACVLVVPALLWTQRWPIHDWLKLQNYSPPPEIAQLASDIDLNDSSKRLFYVYHPALEADKVAFNQHCTLTEQTIVLGCYVSGTGIYLYDVTDERLAGVEQVTAAHEMLHVAYERLSNRERERINALLEQTFATVTNERIKTTIEEYRNNGADINNELHSILGTEVRTLPTELENYYKRYFSDRSKVLTYSEKYESVFAELKQKVAEIDKRLGILKNQIEALEADVDARSRALQSEKARMDSLSSSKRYEEYNAAVPGYNAQVNAYNIKVKQLRQLINEYNALVAERNEIAVQENELFKAIDSRIDTIQTQ